MIKFGSKICERAKVLTPSPTPPPAHHIADVPKFSYDPCSSTGPDAWAALSIDCIGCNQSPINIVPCSACIVEPHASKGLKLYRWDEVPERVVLLNAGTTMKIFFEYKHNGVPTICGGPLEDAYIFTELHFHWANNSKEGSEHYIDGRSSSAEAHAVFYNRKYGTIEKALHHKNGLCVIGRLFDSVCSNKQYLPFISKLHHITKFNRSYTFNEPYTFTLSSVMGSIGFEYFVYQGSLTTPPCSEAVTWIVIMKTKKVSTGELEELRKLRNAKNEWMTPNIRRIQPINGRSILHFKR